MGFQRGRFKRFGQALKAGLMGRGGGGVAHGEGLFKKRSAAQQRLLWALKGPKTLILPSHSGLLWYRLGLLFWLGASLQAWKERVSQVIS
jgi:hypothetical protein